MNPGKHTINADFFRQLDSFSFMVRKRVSSVYAGSRRSINSGKGIDTVGFREYYPGDEPRSIDWKVYARSEKLYVRQFEEDKSLTAHILLDASKSMDYPEKNTTKFEYGLMLAMGFAYMVTKDNDKFAISTFSQDVDIAEPRRGKKYLFQTLDRLETTKLQGKTDIHECIIRYSRAIHSRSLVIIISDFMDDLDSIRSAIYRFSDHDLILVQVLDRTEAQLQVHGHTKFKDLETDADLKTYVGNNFKDNYQRKLMDHMNSIKDTCYHVGAEYYAFTTDVPIFEAFLYTIGRRR